MFEQITEENLLQAIAYTSGMTGVQSYKNAVKADSMTRFLDWYRWDISYCTEGAKEVAQRVIHYLNPTDMFYTVILNSCDELIEFMIEHYEHPYRGNDVCFQGDIIEIDGFCVNQTLDNILVVDAKHPGYGFIISPWKDNWIQLSIFKGFGNMDQRPAAIIPAYVKDELIVTITGRW
jgi:hypothetical protein